MVFEHIEKLKQEYTDKFVIVDESRPELRRFKGLTVTVRTVNMSGRALVEFDAYCNIGWYDIDVDYLSIIDKPLAKPEPAKAEKKPAAKPAAKKKAAAKKPAAAPAKKAGGGMSVEDMLAAARGEKGGAAKAAPAKSKPKSEAAASAPTKVDPKKMSVEEMLTAARGEKGGGVQAAPTKAKPAAEPSGDQPEGKKKMISGIFEASRTGKPEAKASATAPKSEKPKKVDPKKMSVEEMLAAARGEKSDAAATEVASEAEEAVEEPTPAEEAASAEEPTVSPEGGSKRKEITDVDAMIAYCRKVDAS